MQSLSSMKELKYILGYVGKSAGYIKPNVYDFNMQYNFNTASSAFNYAVDSDKYFNEHLGEL